jgi:hypothetical protein
MGQQMRHGALGTLCDRIPVTTVARTIEDLRGAAERVVAETSRQPWATLVAGSRSS